MTSAELRSARDRLLERRRQILRRYRENLGLVEEELDTREIEQVDSAAEQWDARLLSSLNDVDSRNVASIVAAIARIDEGTYGRCVECDAPIEPARLAILPEADRCVDCADMVASRMPG